MCWTDLYSRKAWRHHIVTKHTKAQREQVRGMQERHAKDVARHGVSPYHREGPNIPSEEELRLATDPKYADYIHKESEKSAVRLTELLRELHEDNAGHGQSG